MRSYRMKQVRQYDPCIWNDTESAQISCAPWGTAKGPVASVQLCYTQERIYLRFSVKEQELRIENLNTGAPVYEDNCVEFFVKPEAGEDYLNFEFNAGGIFLIGYGRDRFKRMTVHDRFAIDNVSTQIATSFQNGKRSVFWQLNYNIPFSSLKPFFGRVPPVKNTKWKANFYKCGDRLQQPHYLCWSPIQTAQPDFHQSKYFGDLIFG